MLSYAGVHLRCAEMSDVAQEALLARKNLPDGGRVQSDAARQMKSVAGSSMSPLAGFQGKMNASPIVAGLGQLQRILNDRPDTQPKANRTGLPEQLKSGLEALSGISLDGVRVHRNSSEPERAQALATAQGHAIHLGPGQERHLPHEAWHTVQQMQGRVKPTLQLKSGVLVNDDAGLEREADVMGARAANVVGSFARSNGEPSAGHSSSFTGKGKG